MVDVSLIGRIPLFTSLKPGHMALIAEKLTLRQYRRGAIIFHKDDPGLTLYIMKSGQAKIVTSSSDGEEVILAILTGGDFFGELSILDGKPRSATVVAMEDTSVFTLDRSDLVNVIMGQPEVAIEMLAAMSVRLRHANILIEDASFLDLPARLAKRLMELAKKHGIETDSGLKIDVRMTQQDLANAIGASRETVNRLLGQFQDQGLISIAKQHIYILDQDELTQLTY
jgi:CRP/FNR family cyclic AMP-dependent transcriptional regulator